MKNFLITILIGIFPILLFSQTHNHGQCGVTPDMADMERLIRNQEYAQKYPVQNRMIKHIPVVFHLVARSNGTGRHSEKNTLPALCKLNEEFAEHDFEFYLYDEFNHIDLDEMYNMEFPEYPYIVTSTFLDEKVHGALNIFVGNGLSTNNSGFYTPFADVIYMDRSYINGQDGILAHETGHFFSLPHTFIGWEDTEYDPSQPTPTIVTWAGSGYQVEYVDRDENCEFAADRFCDTPSDYITGWNSCNYNGGAVDPDGVAIDPDERNHMAYYSFGGCSDYIYSPEQVSAMDADYIQRTDMNLLPDPDNNSISGDPVPISPVEITVEEYDMVTFTWDEPDGGWLYFVEIGPLPDMSIVNDRGVVYTNSYTSTALNPNKPNYYYRIIAHNKTDFCDGHVSPIIHFSTGNYNMTALNELTDIEELNVFPNPIKSAEQLTIRMKALNANEFSLKLLTLEGKTVWNTTMDAHAGLNELEIQTTDISAGLYLLKIENENGQILHKISIFK